MRAHLRGATQSRARIKNAAFLAPLNASARAHAARRQRQPLCRCKSHQAPDSTRRTLLFSFAGLAAVPLDVDVGDALQQELTLWQQELQFYQRQLQSFIQKFLPLESSPPAFVDDLQLDTDLASQLLSAPLRALQAGDVVTNWDRKRFQADFKRLFTQELPYFQEAQACGHCNPGESVADRPWFDFLSYIQYKAINLQLPPPPRPGSQQATALYDMMHGPYVPSPPREEPPSPQEALRRASGRLLLEYMQGRCGGAERAWVESSSPALDDVRRGVRVLLDAFQEAGFMKKYGIAFFGASKAEDRNHEVWDVGEPLYLKYWLQSPATFRSSAALQDEDGNSPDFIFATLEAYLAQCGVAAGYFRRFPPPSGSPPRVLAEQCLLQRSRPLPQSDSSPEAAEYLAFELDPCPSPMGCF